jgi:hypothetical protein
MGKTTSGPDHEYTNHGFIRGTQVSRGGLRPRPRPRVYKPRIYPWNTGQSRWSQTTAQTRSIQTTDLSVEHRSSVVHSSGAVHRSSVVHMSGSVGSDHSPNYASKPQINPWNEIDKPCDCFTRLMMSIIKKHGYNAEVALILIALLS